MPRQTKAQIEQAKADSFRAIVISLLKTRHPDWNDWEWDWMHDEARRKSDYRYTEKEDAVLRRLILYSQSFGSYGDYTVQELVAIAYRYRADSGDDEEFVEKLHRWGATELKRRQIWRLAGICRMFENIGYDPLKDHIEQDEKELDEVELA
jgi:hypothetical protein